AGTRQPKSYGRRHEKVARNVAVVVSVVQGQKGFVTTGCVVVAVILFLYAQAQTAGAQGALNQNFPGGLATVTVQPNGTIFGRSHVFDFVVTGVLGPHEAVIQTRKHLAHIAARAVVGQSVTPAA